MEQSRTDVRVEIAAELDSLFAPEIDGVIYSLDEVIGSPGLSTSARAALRKISRKQSEISSSLRQEILRLKGERESEIEKIQEIRLVNPLTERELDILHEIDSGKSAKKIAEVLFLSEATVKSHTQSLYRKLGVNSRVAAINLATKAGILKSQ